MLCKSHKSPSQRKALKTTSRTCFRVTYVAQYTFVHVQYMYVLPVYVWPCGFNCNTRAWNQLSFPKLARWARAACCPCGLLISPAGKCYACGCGSTYAAAARKLHAIASFMIYSIGRYTINYMHLWINVWFDFNFSCSVRSWKCYVDLSTFVACVLM